MEISNLREKFLSAHEKIVGANNILLVTHERPDGDGLSSVCALSVFLDEIKKNHHCFCHDPAPEYLFFLPNIKKVSADKNFNFEDFDLIIVLDCGCLSRARLVEQISRKNKNQTIIEFDHHPRIDDYADIEIRLPGKSSTAEILFHFFDINKISLTPDIANCLLAGIMTDTGNLIFNSVDEETIRISSKLLLAGGAMAKIIRRTNGNKSLGAMKVWGKILENLEINEKYNFAYSIMTWEEIKNLRQAFGNNGIFDAASDILNTVEGVKAVMFLREEEPGKIRGSLRTRDKNVDVSKLAIQLGGGGHAKAAAFSLDGHIVKTETGWKII